MKSNLEIPARTAQKFNHGRKCLVGLCRLECGCSNLHERGCTSIRKYLFIPNFATYFTKKLTLRVFPILNVF